MLFSWWIDEIDNFQLVGLMCMIEIERLKPRKWLKK